jgi:hypothetical protein
MFMPHPYEYKTLTLCEKIDSKSFTGSPVDVGHKLDWALRSVSDYIPQAMNEAPLAGECWEIISHSLSFVNNLYILSILLRRNRK